MRAMLVRVTLPLIVLVLIGAWFFARRFSRPISALIRSADRIGEGDYTSPFDVARRDELGELAACARAHAPEALRDHHHQELPRHGAQQPERCGDRHLPDGIIKSCNEATQGLLGYSEADLVGKSLDSFIDEAHRGAFDLGGAAPEARETVLRTASGQTIPVSMASSSIASWTRSSRAISTSRATSPSASAPSGAYAISRATTP